QISVLPGIWGIIDKPRNLPIETDGAWKVAFDTSLLDAAIAQQQADGERRRQALLHQVLRLLDQLGPQHGISEAYIFGSVVRAGQFSEHSDVDIAVEQMAPSQFFDAMAALSMELERDVDFIELRKCHFADRIRDEGIKWTKKPWLS
ncbi:MAG: nucleotidyltransferase family protein, partial [Anaerolineae bacterium]